MAVFSDFYLFLGVEGLVEESLGEAKAAQATAQAVMQGLHIAVDSPNVSSKRQKRPL